MFQKGCKNYGVSPVIGVILLVAIVVILAALIGIISFGFTGQLDDGSSNAAFELNEQSGTITPIQTDNGTEYEVIVDGNKTKTISGNSVGGAIQIDNASAGSTVQIVNPETDQVIQEWEIDDQTNIGNNNGENNGETGFSGDGLVLTVDTTNSGDGSETNDTTFAIRSGNNNKYNISWSEGNITKASGKTNITWSNPGTYQVEITGEYTHPQFADLGTGDLADAPKIKSIDQWGNIQYDSMTVAFAGATNLTYNANDQPDLSSVQNMNFMFSGAISFNGDISGWDTSDVTNMAYMFNNANSFDQDISSWNTSSVMYMEYMFNNASSFNQDISSWCVSQISGKPNEFDKNAGFDGDTSKQPNWGDTC